ncbi:NAD-binding protein [Mycolicibacterium wolinskyi]|nr:MULTISPECIES: NAD(P)-binding domain-containing protein [Mycolicibacterium]MCV7290732.1 NAD-binding protein [Mycolicibacterium wolinskyi]MCV7291782.1 NAD-binding protein [Mycolicibacterium goodii]
MSVEITTDTQVTRRAPRAGVIGLGMIGGGVAVSLARSGRTPLVYDIRPEAAADLDGVPATEASPAEVARESDVVLIAVVDADQVRAVLNGSDGLLAGAHPGLIVVLLSTVAVPEVHALAEQCAAAGVALLDCGVTPGNLAAHNGLVAMVGGDDHTVRRAMPVLDDFAKKVVHCGPLGAGMATKIARNVVTYGTWRVMHEAAELASSAGVDPETLKTVIEEADPDGTTMFTLLGRTEGTKAFAPQILRLMDKDLAAAQELAAEGRVAVPVVDAVREQGTDTLGIDAEKPSDKTELGLAVMGAVYGQEVADAIPAQRTPALEKTVDHLFAEIWSRPGLSIRDRRLLVMGATAMLGRSDLIEVQVRGALANRELSAEELREAVLQLYYYVGWGNGTALERGVEAALAAFSEPASA